MHLKQHDINGHILALCRTYISTVILADIVPKQPGVARVATMLCIFTLYETTLKSYVHKGLGEKNSSNVRTTERRSTKVEGEIVAA